MTRQSRITLADLDRNIASFPAEIRRDPDWTTWTLATNVIGHFFGKEWVKANIPQDAANTNPPGFFRMDFSSPEKRDLKNARMLDFAETLFNLQHVEGFDDRVDQMRTGDAESCLAEFDFAKLLYIHDVDFRFVIPSGRKGRDYDYRIAFRDGRSACADAKCRIESSEIRPDAIRHALETARKKNLPRDEPGIVFVKVPQAWVEVREIPNELMDVAADFLRQTERVVLVVLYCLVQFPKHGLTVHRPLVDEVENPKHRFDMAKTWRLFKGIQIPREWNGMPPKWHRIFSRPSDDPAYPATSASAL
jgi:hypothetical protein